MGHLIASYGYAAVFWLNVIQCLGLPVPGEAALIAAAVYAQHTHRLDIFWVVMAAGAGTALGSVGGYALGRYGGRPLLMRYGPRMGLNDARMRLGEYLFRLHGGAILAIGRAIPMLRTWGALFAGAYRMPARRFTAYNLVSAALWAAGMGYLAYGLGELAHRASGLVGIATLVATAGALLAGFLYLRDREGALQAQADAALAESR
jgi:membrane protein DedA with SNARE-associated domain